MKFEDKYNINPEFDELFSFKSKEEEFEHDAKMIMFRFFSELEKLNDNKPIKKKDLAKAIETSPSFITQLFRGDKLINLTTLAKIQHAYGITFEIKAKHNSQNYNVEIETNAKCIPFKRQINNENSNLFKESVAPDYKFQINSNYQTPKYKLAR